MAAHTNLSLIEAVETLSSIADLKFDRDVGIAQKHEVLLGDEKVTHKTVHWLHEQDASTTVNLVRKIFRVILYYLRQFYKQEFGHVADQKAIEGIKTIMILVGEAAKKLDKYTNLFQQKQSVTEFKEYRQLQEFYRTKIARKIEGGFLNKWMIGLSLSKHKPSKNVTFIPVSKEGVKWIDTKPVFVDFETVKKDTEYELFFIRKENGSHFFSPRLLRNIKLVCDFGSYFGERKELDPLESVKGWNDRICQLCAKNILKSLGSVLDNFFHEIPKIKNHKVAKPLHKALIALMLSSQSQNLLHHHPVKNCEEYFTDFKGFLREALQTEIYQKWLTYPPKENNQIVLNLMHLIHDLCWALYMNLQGLEEMIPHVQSLIQKARLLVSREHTEVTMQSKEIWNRLSSDYMAMTKLIKHHPNGPLNKVLEILEEEDYYAFDPLLQHNLPNQLHDLYVQDKRYAWIRIPAPIYQEFINKAQINPEFQACMWQQIHEDYSHKHLLINLQDRTSWKEYARCIALENFSLQSEVQNNLSVATLAIDTDFYHQLNPYHQSNHAHVFMEQFKELLLDENAGYFFPPSIKKKELAEFIDETFRAIHRIFFSNKNVLLRESRLSFIELFYMFLQLKLIEWIQPQSISLTCKDGIDSGQCHNAGLFIFIKIINEKEWTQSDWEYLNFMLYAPALLIRERIMLPERFNRMLSAIKTMENAREELGSEKFITMIKKGFAHCFQTPILQGNLSLPNK